MPFDKTRKDEYRVVEPGYSFTYGVGPYQGIVRRYPVTSATEIRDIVVAITILTVALSWVIFGADWLTLIWIAALDVVAGFFIHEMSHKFVARRYGCWAEFRADFRMLAVALFMSFFGFLFAAPGAVMIAGNITREQNGKISIAGPGSNIAVALACMPLVFFDLGLPETVKNVAFGLYYFSVFLGAFNMIPVAPFDGGKIWRWNKAVYVAALLAAGLMFALALLR